MRSAWIGMSPGPFAPRAPGIASCLVGSCAHVELAAAIRCAVATAVPDGESALASWWISTISAVSKNGAAISAKRIISTAPMAKFAATRQFELVNDFLKPSRSVAVKPVVPTTAWMLCMASHGSVTRAASATVKSTATSTFASASARSSEAMVTPWIVAPGDCGSTAATSSNSASACTALHTVAPIRPAAPITPTLIMRRG